ncbi:hypothetical protein [Nitrosovibrio tenuis]|uniref:Uncharacterized protein n=1 Tax=Nitrosovibrio tenuis TaxID=1233 RepID=A0A1H7FWV2_9PROT|nr:hypothetical protein [Nitrosovibrio tenuis]SEK30419.1 hypothetical protein SAMN05216387_101107 [Nitrosovibrio tenuis]
MPNNGMLELCCAGGTDEPNLKYFSLYGRSDHRQAAGRILPLPQYRF